MKDCAVCGGRFEALNIDSKVCYGEACQLEEKRRIVRRNAQRTAKKKIVCKRCGAFVRERKIGADGKVTGKHVTTCEPCQKETAAATRGALWAARTPKQLAKGRRIAARQEARRAGMPEWLVKQKEALAMLTGAIRDMNSERVAIYEGRDTGEADGDL